MVRTLLTPKIKGRSASDLSTHKLMKGSENKNDAIIKLGLPQRFCTSKRFVGKGDAGVQRKQLERAQAVSIRALRRRGGRRGIRTPGGFHLNGFQDRRDRPLRHPSVSAAPKGSRFLLFSGAFSPAPRRRPSFRVRSQAAPGFRSPLLGCAPPCTRPFSQRCAPRKKSAKVPAPECVPMTFPT